MNESKVRGEILPKRTFVMTVAVGEATGSDNKSYELLTSMYGSPVVLSKQTGKYYVLNWDDILDMAIETGIDEPFSKEEQEARHDENNIDH